MNMNYKKISPNLMVEDVTRTVDYYMDVLAFEFVLAVPEEGVDVIRERQAGLLLDWALVRKGGVDVMFQARRSLAEEHFDFAYEEVGGSFTLFIEVEGVDELYERIKEKVQVVRDMETTFYGMKEFIIRDINGYYLSFAQRG